MKRLYNTDTNPVVVGHTTNLAVFPGEYEDFTDEDGARHLATGRWSEKDPRAGLKAELAFKAARDNKDPAKPDEKESTE